MPESWELIRQYMPAQDKTNILPVSDGLLLQSPEQKPEPTELQKEE